MKYSLFAASLFFIAVSTSQARVEIIGAGHYQTSGDRANQIVINDNMDTFVIISLPIQKLDDHSTLDTLAQAIALHDKQIGALPVGNLMRDLPPDVSVTYASFNANDTISLAHKNRSQALVSNNQNFISAKFNHVVTDGYENKYEELPFENFKSSEYLLLLSPHAWEKIKEIKSSQTTKNIYQTVGSILISEEAVCYDIIENIAKIHKGQCPKEAFDATYVATHFVEHLNQIDPQDMAVVIIGLEGDNELANNKLHEDSSSKIEPTPLDKNKNHTVRNRVFIGLGTTGVLSVAGGTIYFFREKCKALFQKIFHPAVKTPPAAVQTTVVTNSTLKKATTPTAASTRK